MPIDPADIRNVRFYPGVTEIARELEAALGESYHDLLADIVKRWEALGTGITPTAARHEVENALRSWPAAATTLYADVIDRIFWAGFMVGVADTGVMLAPDAGDAIAVEWIKNNPHGFVPSLKHFADGERQFFEEVMADAYAGVDVEGKIRPFDLDNMVRRVEERSDEARYKIERVVRTETAKVTSLGRIAAWDNDADRYLFKYHWVATHDARTKDVSLLFERQGPYEFDGIKRRWVEDHNTPIRVINRRTGRVEHQISAFNCRCTAARTPKEPDELLSQGLITRDQYRLMTAA